MKECLAYIDESGDPDFNDSASKIFFLGSVIIDKNSYDEYSDKLDNILNKYNLFEFKSVSKLDSEKR